MSAGNYGKAFAYLANEYGLKTMLIMPETAPADRARVIQQYGTHVEKVAICEMENLIHKYCKENNMVYLHSYNDAALIAGHGSIGLEIMEEIDTPDVVLVSCGGGGVISGIAAAIKLTLAAKHNCRIYGIEPEGACTMYKSYENDEPVAMAVSSIASGLAPPYAGAITYSLCKKYVDAILLVSDDEIKRAMRVLFDGGLVVEPSAAAAFAALCHHKVPDVSNRKVVVVITGGNVTPQELQLHCGQLSADGDR